MRPATTVAIAALLCGAAFLGARFRSGESLGRSKISAFPVPQEVALAIPGVSAGALDSPSVVLPPISDVSSGMLGSPPSAEDRFKSVAPRLPWDRSRFSDAQLERIDEDLKRSRRQVDALVEHARSGTLTLDALNRELARHRAEVEAGIRSVMQPEQFERFLASRKVSAQRYVGRDETVEELSWIDANQDLCEVLQLN